MKISLNELRNKIRSIDKKLLKLLMERHEVVRLIGECKKEEGLPVRDEKVEEENWERLREEAVELGVDPRDFELVFKEIVKGSRRVQRK